MSTSFPTADLKYLGCGKRELKSFAGEEISNWRFERMYLPGDTPQINHSRKKLVILVKVSSHDISIRI